jgi:energy-coupling factor transporter ATP-binding protein EcfA2
MYRLKHVEITGLWGGRTVKFDLKSDVNFLIGANGSGKTTVVNVLAGALAANRAQLQRLPFDRTTIVLINESGGGEATLDIRRQVAEAGVGIRYAVTEPGLPEAVHVLVPRNRLLRPAERGTQRESALQHITRLVNMRWLSVHRAPVKIEEGESESYESTVDIKLAKLSEELAKYASVLSNKLNTRLWRFFDTVFLSLLDQPSFASVSDAAEDLDINEERQTIGEMFETMWLERQQFEPKMNAFMQMWERAVLKQKEGEQLELDEVGAMFAMTRLRMLEHEWRLMKLDQEQIEKPFDDFRNIVNRLFKRKSVEMNPRNELTAKLQNGEPFDLKNLSSGEKQLVIILGEALLQHGAPSVYLADEPELSLHVEWQERLVSSIRELNSGAQLVFATHSPDIVSEYGDRVIDMEAVLQ